MKVVFVIYTFIGCFMITQSLVQYRETGTSSVPSIQYETTNDSKDTYATYHAMTTNSVESSTKDSVAILPSTSSFRYTNWRETGVIDATRPSNTTDSFSDFSDSSETATTFLSESDFISTTHTFNNTDIHIMLSSLPEYTSSSRYMTSTDINNVTLATKLIDKSEISSVSLRMSDIINATQIVNVTKLLTNTSYLLEYSSDFLSSTTSFSLPELSYKAWSSTDLFSLPEFSSNSLSSTDLFSIPELSSNSWSSTDLFSIPEFSSKSWSSTDLFSLPEYSSYYWNSTSLSSMPTLSSKYSSITNIINANRVMNATYTRKYLSTISSELISSYRSSADILNASRVIKSTEITVDYSSLSEYSSRYRSSLDLSSLPLSTKYQSGTKISATHTMNTTETNVYSDQLMSSETTFDEVSKQIFLTKTTTTESTETTTIKTTEATTVKTTITETTEATTADTTLTEITKSTTADAIITDTTKATTVDSTITETTEATTSDKTTTETTEATIADTTITETKAATTVDSTITETTEATTADTTTTETKEATTVETTIKETKEATTADTTITETMEATTVYTTITETTEATIANTTISEKTTADTTITDRTEPDSEDTTLKMVTESTTVDTTTTELTEETTADTTIAESTDATRTTPDMRTTTAILEIDCGSLPSIANGNLMLDNSTNTFVDSTATVLCNEGFSESSSSIQCLDTGRWEDANCTLIDCGVLSVTNGNFNNSVTTYGTVVGVDCIEGYTTGEDSTVECQSNGTWSGNLACDLVDCGSFPLIYEGTLSLRETGNTSFGALADLTCAIGYNTTLVTITCLDTGEWENTTCDIVDCGIEYIYSVSYSWVTLNNGTDTTFGASANVECLNGYETNVTTIYCQSSGEWETTECTRIYCGSLPSIANGNLMLDNSTNTFVDSTATVLCNDGFSESSSSIQCLNTGRWEDANCTLIDCGVLSVTNGNVNNSVTTYGTVVGVDCIEGYTTGEDSTVECQSNGTWSGNLACDLVDCGSFPLIYEGTLSLRETGNTSFGALADLTCAIGYNTTLVTITCLDTGEWENTTCDIVDCGIEYIYSVSNSWVTLNNGTDTTFGASANVECLNGYETNVTTIYCQSSGEWETTECTRIYCGSLPSIANGNLMLDNSTNTFVDSTATVLCNEGFSESSSSIQCLNTGQWEDANCTLIDCGVLSVTNGNFNNSVTTYGTVVGVDCIEGYTTGEDSTVECQSNGTWSGNLACDLVDCNSVPVIEWGSITPTDGTGNTTYGSIANVTCVTGFSPSKESIQCLSTGNWEDVSCIIIDCGAPPNDTSYGNFTLDIEGVTMYGANATLICDEGYETSSPVITCEEYKTWSSYEPCIIIDCNTVPVIERGTITPTGAGNTTYGAFATVTCDLGFIPSRVLIQCLSTGYWENASCEIIGDVPSINNGTIALKESGKNTFGALADVTCNAGYNATLDTIECLDTGIWENTTCEIVVCGDVPSINDGSIALQENGNSSFGALADVTCDRGYNTTLDTIQCLETGKWENTTCDIIVCGDVNSISDGSIALQENGNDSFGALADVTCDKGYNATLDTIQCLDTGKWEYSACDIVVCGDVPSIIDGSIALQENGNNSFGALADVTCDTGYTATLDTIQCLDTGKWENTTCDIVVCGDVPSINDGSIALQESGNNSFGALADVTCNIGYNATKQTIECLYTGEWENTTCDVVVCGDVPSIDDGSIALQEDGNNSYGALADVTCAIGYNSSLNTIECLYTGEWENTTCDVIVCGVVPSITDGSIVLRENGNNSFGALADVICDTGYNTTLDTIQCLDTGKWENTTCDIVVCGDLPSINSGSITLQDIGNSSYGALADVTCDTGYNTTLDTIQCLDTGKWENTTCYIVVCGDVPLINSGSIALQENGNSSYGALANVTCDTGYNTTLDTIQCLETGKWENTTCDIVVCGDPPLIIDGSINLQVNGTNSYGALAKVTCQTGYNATLDTIECLDTGEWENTTCNIVDCGENPLVTKGTVTLLDQNVTTYGAFANVTCEEGYNASISIIQCLQTGIWQKTECQILDCDAVPDVENGVVSLLDNENTTYGTLAKVTCNRGYNSTSETIRCLKTGNWETSECEILNCGAAPVISDGQITLVQDGNTTYGALANVSCSTGYNATLNTIQCLDTGEWDNATCDLIVCGDFPSISHGSTDLRENGNNSFGALADVTCDTGYNTTLGIIQCLETGKWENTTCDIVVCGPVPTINGGSIALQENGNNSFGALADVTCDTGYNTTSDTIQCLDTGKWENTTCDIIVCGPVPLINGGSIALQDSGNNSFGALADVTCYTGFNTTLNTIQCLETGKWENTTCDVVFCGEVPAITDGNIALKESGNKSFGALADVTCEKGYNTTLDVIQCLDTGKWENTSCDIVVCGNPPSINDGIITLQENGTNWYGALATVTCDTGHNATLDTIECLDTGEWENTTCDIIVCGLVPLINDGSIALQESGNNSFGSLADVKCDTGYNTTLDTIQCLETGKWENTTCDIVVCGDVPSINDGNIVLQEIGNNSFGALANVTCENGYNTTLGIIQCLDTGKWENTTCDIVVCGNPPSINNGIIALQENGTDTYGTLATVTCDTGYNASLNYIECLDTGEWENTTCDIVDCGETSVITKGNVTLLDENNTTYGALANVSCDEGYNASISQIQCQQTGKWQKSQCQILDCEAVPDVDNGFVSLLESENTTYGTLAEVTCNRGYNSTSKTIKCLETGKWETPECEILNCTAVPVISNGQISLEQDGNTTYDALASVSCSTGYNATLDTIQCLDTGEWDNATCDLIVCGDVPPINNGDIALQENGNNSFGALADVTCDTGYNTTLDTIQCLETGKWENATCDIVVCGPVPAIDGGTISLHENGNNSFGALADVTCETGYNTTLDTIQCLDTGKWENTTCDIVVCGTVPSINSGSITLKESGNNSFGALADVTCDTGYNTTLDTIQCLDTGKWENSTCDVVVCGDPPSINDGSIALLKDGNKSYGALATVTCDTGYNATLDTIECLDTGEWENTTCDIIECGNVPKLDNGSVELLEEGKTSYGAEASVSCEVGFNATMETIQCMDTGKWDYTSCEIIDCMEIPVVIKGTATLLDENNTTYGALANVSCEQGYNASVTIIQCLQTGKWQKTECQILDCKAVPGVLNGVVTLLDAENTTYGTLAEVTCNKGYNSTPKTIKCLDTGEWEIPQCEILSCDGTPVISDGQVTLKENGNSTYGALANVACSTGYNATVDTIQCLDTGQWDNATCILIDCGELDDLMNGTINTSNGTTYGSVATYACDVGFDIVGDETRVCLQNGKWSNMKPDCLIEGSKRCQVDTDTRGTVWHEVAAGKIRNYDCRTNFTGTIKRRCGSDGVWKFPEYLCMRESVKNAIDKIELLNENATQQDVLKALQGLKDVTTQAEDISEQDKMTDLEVRSLITSSETIANLLSDSPNLVSDELANDLTETFSNLIDDKNAGSWSAITQTSSKVAEKMLTSVDALSNAMAKRVKSSGTNLKPVVKPNLALHVTAMTPGDFVFPGPDAVQGTSSNNWLNETRSQINVNPASFGGTAQQSVVTAAMFRDISNIMPDKSDDEQLNGQILSFSTLPPLTGTIDPPITMSFEQSNTQLTRASCSFWKFDESGADGYWSTEGCSAISSSEGFTECACNHTTNFAVILSLQDCDEPKSLNNGEIDSSYGTKYEATVRFSCDKGYNVNGANTSVCLFNGSWSSPNPTCSIKDCDNLENPANGNVSTPDGTTFDQEASYTCNEGYSVNGAVTRLCLSNGTWSSSAPTCVEIKDEVTKCNEDVDSRGLTWPKTISGNTNDKRCQQGFTGSISRTCGPGGVWKLPKYNCVRESIEKVNKKVSTLNENTTVEEVDTVLEEILKVTSLNETTESINTLTDGELTVLSSSLETVADVLKSTSGVINENITEEFLEIASNLVDDSNQDSWQSLSQSGDNDGSEKVLKAVDSLAEVLSKSVEDDPENNGTLIVKKNIAMEVKRVSKKDVIFPDPGKNVPADDDEDAGWFKQSISSLKLDAKSLTNTSVSYSTTAVMFRDLSKILPKRQNNDSDESSQDTNDTINAPILSLTISPPVSTKLNPPLRLTFAHNVENLSNPECVYWAFPSGKIGQGFWSSEGCAVDSTHTNYTVCECDHLTNFAVLMSPFIEADAASEALRIISMVGIGISIACLAVTFIVHICLWRNLRNDRTTALMNLCFALLLSYILFLAGIDRTESSVACAVIAAVLQYIYLVVFCIMLVEGIEIAITVLYVFKTKSRIKILLVFAWVIPAIIVGISLGATQAEGYGNDNFCWLSVDNGLIWAFVGPALLIITFNAICLIIVIRIMFKTKAMETKTSSEKIKTSVRSLCVLVPVMGVSWVLGIFYMNDSFYFIQYIFAILNGLQGFFIFLFHCCLNEQVKKAIQLRNRRRSSTKETLKTTLRSTSRDERKSKDLRETGRSFIDSSDFAQDESNDWKDKIIQPEFSQPDVKFATPLGFHANGRRTATFAVESRDRLTSHMSGSDSDASKRSSARLEANLFSARF